MKSKDILNLGKNERKEKLKELKMELVKAKVNPSKSGAKAKEIKKMIARIISLNTEKNNEVLKKQ